MNQNQNQNTPQKDYLGPPINSLNRSRSRSPTPKIDRKSVSPSRRSPNMARNNSLIPPSARSRSPTPHFVSTQIGKITNKQRNRSRSPTPSYITNSPQKLVKNKSLSPTRSRSPTPNVGKGKEKHVSSIQIPMDTKVNLVSEASLQISDPTNTDHSDNASEVSDEGYRSLGVIQTDKTKNRLSLNSQNSVEDAEFNGECDNLLFNISL